MAQKYKVFFNDCLLMIADTRDCPPGICHEIVQKLNGDSIGQLVSEFESSGITSYCICHRNPEALFELFAKSFKTIYAAGGIVRDPSGRFLFIKRFNKWDLPKGKAEKGESPAENALREVEEECRIKDLSIRAALPDTYHTYWLNKKRILKKTSWFAMDYHGSEEPQPQIEEGITDTIWLPPSLFDTVLRSTYRSLATLINDIDWKKFP